MKIFFTVILSFLCLLDANASQATLTNTLEQSESPREATANARNNQLPTLAVVPIDSNPTKSAELVKQHVPAEPIFKPQISEQRLKTLVSFCAPCHGTLGVASQSIYPNLVGQSGDFVFKQLQAYKYKQRKNIIMQGMVSRLNEQDMLALAQYYANLDSNQKSTESALTSTSVTEQNL